MNVRFSLKNINRLLQQNHLQLQQKYYIACDKFIHIHSQTINYLDNAILKCNTAIEIGFHNRVCN